MRTSLLAALLGLLILRDLVARARDLQAFYTDFGVMLADVHPDGTSAQVSFGVLNLTHREGHSQPKPLAPGERYDIEFTATEPGDWMLHLIPTHRAAGRSNSWSW